MPKFLSLASRVASPAISAMLVLVSTALVSTPIMAMPVTHKLTATIDGNPLVTSDSPFNGLNRVFTRYQVTQETGFPFVLNEGDTIETAYTVINGGLTLRDSGFGLDEMLFQLLPINSPFVPSLENPNSQAVVVYRRTTSVTATNFLGDYAGDTLVTNVRSTSGVPAVSLFDINNFTDSAVTLFNFTISSTFTDIDFQPGFEAYAGPIEYVGGGDFITLDQFAPISVPAPGTLVFLGLGLLGCVARHKGTIPPPRLT